MKRGKQRELIKIAKGKMSWNDLSKILKIYHHYLSYELYNEITSLSEEKYESLCKIANKNYDSFIFERRDDDWGRSKGGNKSKKVIKEVFLPKESVELAEFIGIILGDGSVEERIDGKKIRCYSVKVTGGLLGDYDYITRYVKNMIKNLFRMDGSVYEAKKYGGIRISVYGKNLVNFMKEKGLGTGNKKNNNQGIPKWILNNEIYLKACLRGLIDTDGCIYYIAKSNKNLRIIYVSHIPQLLNDVRNSFLKLGIKTSKIMNNRQIYISEKANIEKYLKEIGFCNSKHLKRLENLKSHALFI